MTDESAVSSRSDGEAAAWFTRLNTNKVSNADLNAFFDWRRSPDNAAAYARVEKVRGLLEQLRDDPEIRAMAERALQRGSWRRDLKSKVLSIATPGRPLVWGTLSAAAVAAAFVVASMVDGRQTFETAIGERRVVRLEDGTSVSLNTDSAVKIRLGQKRRDIELQRGQAFFDVAHDEARPFVVQAGDTKVRALGTRFDVRKTGSEVLVVLTEGKVEVSKDGGAPASLTPGQSIKVARKDPASFGPTPVDIAAATSWTGGHVTLKDAPLIEAVAEINRYSRHKIVLGEGASAEVEVNGVFDSGDTDGFVLAMTKLLDLESQPRWNGDIVLRQKTAKPAAK